MTDTTRSQSRWQSPPFDILSLIFLSNGREWPKSLDLTCPLLRVSSSWRRIALATPSLWTKIDLEPQRSSEARLRVLQYWLSLTEGHQVDLEITCSYEYCYFDSGARALIKRFHRLLLSRVSSWGALRVYVEDLETDFEFEGEPRRSSGPALLVEASTLSKASRLKELTVNFYTSGELCHIFTSSTSAAALCPNLKNCSIQGIFVPPQFGAPNLLSLTLSKCSLDGSAFRTFVDSAPLLQTLTFVHPIPELDEKGAAPYALPSLKSMSFHDGSIPLTFFDNLCDGAPLLEDLVLNYSAIYIPVGDVPRTRPYTLRSFRLDMNEEPEEGALMDPYFQEFDWGHIVNHSPNLSTLSMVYSEQTEFPAVVRSALVSLTLRLSEDYPIYDQLFEEEEEVEMFRSFLEAVPDLRDLSLTTLGFDSSLRRTSYSPLLWLLSQTSGTNIALCPVLEHLDLTTVAVDHMDDILDVALARQSSSVDFRISIYHIYPWENYKVTNATYDVLKEGLEIADRERPLSDSERDNSKEGESKEEDETGDEDEDENADEEEE